MDSSSGPLARSSINSLMASSICGLIELFCDLFVLNLCFHHFTELANVVERAADASVRVKESDNLSALEMRDILVVVVQLEKNLESCSVTSGLKLAPETALVAANAVHKTTDVAEAVAEVLLQRRALAVNKHETLVKDLGNTGCFLGDFEDLCAGGSVFRRISQTKLVLFLLEVGAKLGDGAGHEGVVKVDVSNTVGELVQTVFVAAQVGRPLSGSLIEKIPAQMGANAGVHSRHDTVKHTLLETLILHLEASVCDKRCVGVLLAPLLKLGLATSRVKDLFKVLSSRTVLPSRLTEIGRFGERTLLEAVLSVDGVPDLLCAVASVSSESFRVSDQAHSFNGAADVAAHAILVIPEGTFLVEEVNSVVGEKVGVLGEIVDGGFGVEVQFVEGGIGSAGVANDGLW
ncbi:hypothetical protein HG531_003776 [Fusarium graminearum]|nr:hypothetical protein HG531_003776 [Fusarium graminearum]